MSDISHPQDADVKRAPDGAERVQPNEALFALLKALKLAVDEIRATLSDKRKETYTTEELARISGRSPYTIRRWIKTGKIRAIRIDGTGPKGRLLIPRAELEALVESGRGEGVPTAAL